MVIYQPKGTQSYWSCFLWTFIWCSFNPAGSYIPEGLMTSCTWDYATYTTANRSYTMMLCCFVFFIPLGIIFFCYLRMFLSIRKTGRYYNVNMFTCIFAYCKKKEKRKWSSQKLPIFSFNCLFCPSFTGRLNVWALRSEKPLLSNKGPSGVSGNWQRLPLLSLWCMSSPGRHTPASHWFPGLGKINLWIFKFFFRAVGTEFFTIVNQFHL